MTDEIEKKKKRVAYMKTYMKAYYEANKERKSANDKVWREENKEDVKAYHKTYYQVNKEKRSNWFKENREKINHYSNDYNKTYIKNRCAKDPIYKLTKRIRALTCNAFKRGGWKKNSKTQELLGCDFTSLQVHLIASAIRNYGSYSPLNEYHIDHIIPISLAKTEEDIIKLSHYSNLQFLTPSDNMSKSNKYENSDEALRV